jgi:hypothetical protein
MKEQADKKDFQWLQGDLKATPLVQSSYIVVQEKQNQTTHNEWV